ncbi:MAG: ABC transporter substrate-binding protein [Campylobacterota bacterium]
MRYVTAALIAAVIGVFWLDGQKIYDNRTVVFGASLPKSGIMKEWGQNVINGARSYFEYANANNLLKDRKIRLVALDDKYEPDLTLKNTKNLISDSDIFALFGFVGTPTVKNILPVIRRDHFPLIAPFTGASFLREGQEHIINLRPGYYKEIETIVSFLHENKAVKEFAVFYQNDDYGYEGYTSLIKILRDKDLALSAEGAYKRNTLSIEHAYKEIKQSNAGAVLLIGAAKANASFIKRAKNDPRFEDTVFAAVSFGDANAMVANLPKEYDNIIYSQVVPSYNDLDNPLVAEYRSIFGRNCPSCEYGFISFEAFIAAKMITQALQHSPLKLTQKAFVQTMRRSDLQTTLDKVYLFTYENGAFVEIGDD